MIKHIKAGARCVVGSLGDMVEFISFLVTTLFCVGIAIVIVVSTGILGTLGFKWLFL